MAFVASDTPLGHEHKVRMRRAKYSGATKSAKSWLDSQLKIREDFEREYIANMSDKEFVRFMRSKLNRIFNK